MRHATLLELAERDGLRLPDALVHEWPPRLSAADEKGWFRFQRLYDVARSVLRTEDDVRRLVREAAEDDRARVGGGWRSRSTPAGTPPASAGSRSSPTWCSTRRAEASRDTGLGIAVVIAANRTRHPMDARTLARLAAQYAGRGVVGFGLSNDERRGTTTDFAPAFRIAERAGLLLAPHGGELLGPESVRTCVDDLHAGRLGHGVRVVEDPALLDRVVERAWPWSCARSPTWPSGLLRPHLGAAAGAARGRGDRAPRADDPLLFGSRLAGQYASMRAAHELTDAQLADLARSSVRASRAPEEDKQRWSSEIDAWLGA